MARKQNQQVDARQGRLDFGRGEQLFLIRSAVLPRVEGVSRHAMRLVLSMVDDYGRGRQCFASEATLARACCMTERHLRRVVRALERLSLLAVRRERTNHYVIVWSELALLAASRQQQAGPSQVATSCCQPPEQADPAREPDMSAPEPDMRAREPDILSGRTGPGSPVEALLEAQEEPPPPGALRCATAARPRSDSEWREVEAKLREAGIGSVCESVRTAQRLAIPPAELLAAVEFFRGQRFDGPGALVFWIRNFSAGRPIHEGWPTKVRPPAARRDASREAWVGRVYFEVVRDGRRAGQSDGEIAAELRRRGLTEDEVRQEFGET